MVGPGVGVSVGVEVGPVGLGVGVRLGVGVPLGDVVLPGGDDEVAGGGGGAVVPGVVDGPVGLLADPVGVRSGAGLSRVGGRWVSTRSCGSYGFALALGLVDEPDGLLTVDDGGAVAVIEGEFAASRGLPIGDFAAVGHR